jgi:aspergillopepsin I
VGSTKVTGQVVELATQVSSSFVSGAGDGLLGLAFSSINTVQPTPAKTFFDNAQSGLDKPIFAAYLPKDTDGAYDFGSTDSAKFTGTLQYTDVDSSNGFWEYPSTSFKVGSTSGQMSGFTGITDTGTTLVLMSDAAVTAYYKQVSGSSSSQTDGGYIFDCSTTLPDLSFAVGDNTATIPGSLINFAAASESGKCFGGVQSVGQGTQNIYGDVFLNANYGVFDASGPSFGFATSTGPTS